MDQSNSKMALTGHVLIVAGTDPTGGAGIVRDIETTAHFHVKAGLAITSVNVQDDRQVAATMPVTADILRGQMLTALKAHPIGAIKIGMTGSVAVVEAICSVIDDFPQIPIILDPVIAASSGGLLADHDTVEAITMKLIRYADLLTPNLNELALLSGNELARDKSGALSQARELLALGAKHVLVKGGHASGDASVDSLVSDTVVTDYSMPRLHGTMRGTGCMLSTAVACQLVLGKKLPQAVEIAKKYVYAALIESGLEYNTQS